MTEPTSGERRLTQATELLRQHTDAGWKAMRADVLNRARRAFRPSAPVRSHHDLGDFFIACDVVVARLQAAIDPVAGAAAQRITCTTDQRHHLDGVTIEIVAAYGTHLLTVARHVHEAAGRELNELLGAYAPPHSAIHTHVHIEDITDDPHFF
ncbi:hypothetical protein [Actinoplanes sp. NPDC051859]|uniref:hypothetical protein n=1 Tax=Actinoplanes sp. NPDC051859 TaxID=3363909 RepID=UPI00379E121F